MYFLSIYSNRLGEMYLLSTDKGLAGIYFKDQKNLPKYLFDQSLIINKENFYIKEAKKWLDAYFNKEAPEFKIKLDLTNLSKFQKNILDILLTVPYGKVLTYKDIANIYLKKFHQEAISYRAIGRAISHNPIAIYIPCHRIIGQNNKLVGYAGGLIKKEFLLDLES